jgi:hypothetical protein
MNICQNLLSSFTTTKTTPRRKHLQSYKMVKKKILINAAKRTRNGSCFGNYVKRRIEFCENRILTKFKKSLHRHFLREA